jgi:hypothetical protein
MKIKRLLIIAIIFLLGSSVVFFTLKYSLYSKKLILRINYTQKLEYSLYTFIYLSNRIYYKEFQDIEMILKDEGYFLRKIDNNSYQILPVDELSEELEFGDFGGFYLKYDFENNRIDEFAIFKP